MTLKERLKTIVNTFNGRLWRNDTFSMAWQNNNIDYGTFDEYMNQGLLNPYVYSVTKKITDLMIDLPFINLTNRGKEVQDIDYTLFYFPNSNQTQADFLRVVGLNLLSSGNAFIRKTLAGKRVVAMKCLNTNEVEIITNVNNEILYYSLKQPNGTDEKIPLEEIWHIRFENLTGTFKDKLYGLSPLKAGWQIVQSSNHITQTERLIYENRAINTILTNDSDRVILPKEKEELDNSFNDDLRGVEKGGRIKITTAKLRAIDISMTPQQLQMNVSDTKKLRQICGLYNVPSFIFGDTEKSTYNNMKEAYVSLYRDSILPLTYFILAEFTELFQNELGAKTKLSVREADLEILNTIDIEYRKQIIEEQKAGIITIEESRNLLGYGKEII